MRRIAIISRDDLLIGRVRAAAADTAQLFVLSGRAEEIAPEIASLKPSLLLVELEGGDTLAALPQIVHVMSGIDPDVPVVVLGDTGNAADVLAAVRAGSTDFIDREEPIGALSSHMKRRFAVRSGDHRDEGRAYSVVLNAQPGSSAGLFALDLAIVRAQRSEEALLIDCHLPVSEAGAALDIPLSYSVADAVRDAGRLDRTLLLSEIARHEASGLRVLPLSLRSTDNVNLSADTLLAALRAIRPLFGETIVNAGGIREPMLLAALTQWASTVYLVCPQKFTALRDAKDLLAALPADFDTARRLVLVVDAFSPAINLSPEKMLTALEIERMIVLPDVRVDLMNGVNVGRPYILSRPRTPYALAIEAAAADGKAPARSSRLRGIVPKVGGRLRGLKP